MALNPSTVRSLLDRHGVRPSRALGQNFVIDPNTIDRVVRLAGVEAGDAVVEIGPGLGSLTVALADAGAEVVAIEVDRHLLAPLQEAIGDRAVRVVHGDAAAVDWAELLDGSKRWKLVANLPYNVATTMVIDVLERAPMVGELLVMVQREVGERLAADPGSSDIGIPSLRVAYFAVAEVLGRVPATVFHPKPKVESVLVRITRRTEPAVDADPDRLFALIRTAFGTRRKMLRRSLLALVDPAAFDAAGVSPEARPQELSLGDWDRLARAEPR